MRGSWCNLKQEFVCSFTSNLNVPCITKPWSSWSRCGRSVQTRYRDLIYEEWNTQTREEHRILQRCPLAEYKNCRVEVCMGGEVRKRGVCVPRCPRYAIDFGNRCLLYSNVAEPFKAAELFCVGIGGHLANFQSLSEQEYFFNSLKTVIAPRYPNVVVLRDAYIGAKKMVTSSQLRWTNGINHNFTNWKMDPTKVKPGCVVVFWGTGEWRIDPKCKNKAFICEFPIGSFKEFQNENSCGLPQLDAVRNPIDSWPLTVEHGNSPKKESIDEDHIDNEIKEMPNQSRQKRLVRGYETNNTYWPWYVDTNGCGAALVHPKIVVTAAHCGINKKRAWLGWVNKFAGTDRRYADIPMEVHKPAAVPAVREGGFGGCRADLAIYKMKNSAPYTELIRPACIPDYGAKPPNFEEFYCFATGRGSAKDTTYVNQIQLRATGNPRYINGAIKTEDVHKRSAVCLGDSGSPLNCRLKNDSRWYVYGPACGISGCKGGDSAYFVSLISWRPWIDKTLFDLLH